MRLLPIGAVCVTAAALYLSGGVLDQVLMAGTAVRVALLPPWPAFVAFLGMAALGWLVLDHRARPRGTSPGQVVHVGTLVLPLFALALLLLPYLPWLADAMPALQMLAGPARWILWLIVATQVLWVLWQARLVHARVLQRLTLTQAAVGVGLATLLVAGAVSTRFAGTVLYPAGDEPHYLVIAQSLWRDGDLRIENNHTRGDYREYFPRDLAPHYLTRGSDGEIYSIHPVGMPVLIAPVYAAGGYPAVVSLFVLMAAAAAGLAWRAIVQTTGLPAAATFGWSAVAMTTPFLFNAFAVYPEVPAALAVVIAFTLLTGATGGGLARWLAVGVCAAALPWFSTKYSPMSSAIVVVALARIWFPSPPTATSIAVTARAAPAQLAAAAAVLGPYLVSLAGWFAFFAIFWGIPLPQAPYGDLVQTSPWNLIFGAPGLIVDQEYGLLPYAPVYVLAGTGLWIMWRAGGAARRQAMEVALIFGALLGTVGAFRIWWGGSASPGRPLTSGLLLLAWPMAFAFAAAVQGSAQRAAQHLLLWASIGVSGVLCFAQNGLLTANGRDGTSSLLEYLSPRWPAWSLAPSFIYHEAWTALAQTAVWLILAGAAAAVVARWRAAHAGTASLAAAATAAAAMVVAVVMMPRLPLSPPWPALELATRARLPLLDDFDRRALPVAIAYTPFTPTSAATLLPSATVEVTPGARTDPQPVRVLHNGRFSLPAGSYRIEVTWSGTRGGEQLGLQVGRTGGALQVWPVEARAGETWSREITLPVDASFIGLRGTPELERSIGRIRFVPLDVVDASQRPRGPAVIAASQSGPASIFYVDTNASPEETGFWVWGQRVTRVIMRRTSGDGPLVLKVHSGPIANRLHLSAPGFRETVLLAPDAPQQVEVPMGEAGAVTLEFRTDLAFVPRDTQPGSNDDRGLGAWVEVIR